MSNMPTREFRVSKRVSAPMAQIIIKNEPRDCPLVPALSQASTRAPVVATRGSLDPYALRSPNVSAAEIGRRAPKEKERLP